MVELTRKDEETIKANREKEVDELRSHIVSVFWGDEVPQFRQGHPMHELEDVVTAELCTSWIAEIINLRKRVRELEQEGK